MQGLQWLAFFHILTIWMGGPPRPSSTSLLPGWTAHYCVGMTGLGSSSELLIENGKLLSNFAKRHGMPFTFHPIARKFEEIDASILQIWPNKTIAVHCFQHSLYDQTEPDWNTLRLFEELEPRIIVLVEQDELKKGSFLVHFVGSLHYYSNPFFILLDHVRLVRMLADTVLRMVFFQGRSTIYRP